MTTRDVPEKTALFVGEVWRSSQATRPDGPNLMQPRDRRVVVLGLQDEGFERPRLHHRFKPGNVRTVGT